MLIMDCQYFYHEVLKMSIQEIWNDRLPIKWWPMFWMGLFFLVANTVIFLAMWYVRRGVAIEYGYPKRNRKTMRKKLAKYSLLENILLLRLTKEAERKGMMLYINLVCHFLSMAALGTSIVGFFGCMITLADGWALTLLIVSEIAILFVTGIFEFIPHLIWLPSERKRYKWK